MDQDIITGAPGRYWHVLPDGRVQCDLCPRFCKLHEGQRGFCFVRACQAGEVVLTTYGRSSGFCIDPIIFLEYAIDVALACRELGIKTVAVTAGEVCAEPRAEFYRVMDAANV